MTIRITEEQAREYVSGYFEQNEDCERFRIKSVAPSRQGPECLEVSVYTEWRDGNCDSFPVTCWLENGQPYGEW